MRDAFVVRFMGDNYRRGGFLTAVARTVFGHFSQARLMVLIRERFRQHAIWLGALDALRERSTV